MLIYSVIKRIFGYILKIYGFSNFIKYTFDISLLMLVFYLLDYVESILSNLINSVAMVSIWPILPENNLESKFVHSSEIWLADCFKSGENLKNNNNVTICRQYVVIEIFWPRCISLIKFRKWFKFSCQFCYWFQSYKKISPSEICPIFGDWCK